MKHPYLKVGDAVQFRDYGGSVYAAEVISFTTAHCAAEFVDCPNLKLEDGRVIKSVGKAASDTVMRVWLPLEKAEK